MIELRDMAAGLAALGVAFNREIGPHLAEVYHGVIGARLDAVQWQRAIRRSLEAESFFPPPAVLLRYGLGDSLSTARAAEVYERILGHFERGDVMGPREVGEQYGTAAMEAVTSAGGVRAFTWCEPASQPFRFKAFVEAWAETTRVDPSRELPEGDARGLIDE